MNNLTALVLAGTRAGGDPLAAGAGVSHKALIDVAGRAMIEHVVQALDAVPEIGRIILLPQVPGSGFDSREHILTLFAEEVMPAARRAHD